MKNTKDNLSLNDDVIEKLICHEVYTNESYRLVFQNNYDKRWMDNENIHFLIKIAIQFHAKYGGVPSRDVLKELLNKISQTNTKIDVDAILGEFDSVNKISNSFNDKNFVKDNIFHYIHRKGVYYAIIDNLDKIENKSDISNVIDSFQKIFNITLDSDLGFNYHKQIKDHLAKLSNPEARLPTGLASLDDQLRGGLYRDGRCLFVFLAMPGLGKSQFLANVAVNHARQNGTVVIITLEMSEDVYGSRVDALISDIEINSIGNNTEQAHHSVETFFKEHPNANILIKEYPPYSVNCNTIENYLNKLISQGIKPTMIVVDYIGLLMPNNSTGGEGLYEKGCKVSKELRALSYKFNAPVVTAAQVNRNGYNTQDVGMEDVSESASINMDADGICALFEMDDDRTNGIINAVMRKNRFGGILGKVLKFKSDRKTLKISEFTGNKSVAVSKLGDDLSDI